MPLDVVKEKFIGDLSFSVTWPCREGWGGEGWGGEGWGGEGWGGEGWGGEG